MLDFVAQSHKVRGPLAPLAAAALLLALAVDVRVPVFGAVAPDRASAAYAAIRGDGRLLELPVFRPDIHFGSVYLGYARQSPRERPQGYSTTAPPAADRLARLLRPLSCGRGTIPPALGIRFVVVHRGVYAQSRFFGAGLRRRGGGRVAPRRLAAARARRRRLELAASLIVANRTEPFAAADESLAAMGSFAAILDAARPYRMHALLLAYTPALLYVDGRNGDRGTQVALGFLTFAVLIACVRGLGPVQRRQVWICVPVATLFEVFGSLIWGGYHYQLHNIPLYVPPGHALVYVFGITAGALPLMRRHGKGAAHVVLGLATIWTVAGLTVLPLLGRPLDLPARRCGRSSPGASCGRAGRQCSPAIWVATATLEIAGTLPGCWTWVAVAPWSHLAMGNPPSAIAAGYAVIDGSVVLVAGAVAAALSARRPREPRAAAVRA